MVVDPPLGEAYEGDGVSYEKVSLNPLPLFYLHNAYELVAVHGLAFGYVRRRFLARN